MLHGSPLRTACRYTLTLRAGQNDQFKQFSDILAQSRSRTPSTSQGNFFDGNFSSGSFVDPTVIANMQSTLRQSLTPEMRESMAAMLQSSLQNGDGMPGGQMGMMAFGMGENEKGKKVARAAKLSYDLKTGKVNKDFVEEQLEPDDAQLPKETVENYSTEGAIEVEFMEDQKQVDAENISEADIEVETVTDSSNRSS